MPDPLAGLPPCSLRTPEAARWLGVSSPTLEKQGIYETGQVYRKIGIGFPIGGGDDQTWRCEQANSSSF
jgi:hypothetical protein